MEKIKDHLSKKEEFKKFFSKRKLNCDKITIDNNFLGWVVKTTIKSLFKMETGKTIFGFCELSFA